MSDLEFLVRDLRAQGFDRSCVQETEDYAFRARVGCSRCQAAVIQGVACHEVGCPNAKERDSDTYGQEEDYSSTSEENEEA